MSGLIGRRIKTEFGIYIILDKIFDSTKGGDVYLSEKERDGTITIIYPCIIEKVL